MNTIPSHRIIFSSLISIVCILLFNSNARCENTNIARISVSNGNNSDETIILFNPSASNGYDAYDSQKMFNNSALMPEIYTIADGQLLVINGLTSIATNPTQILGFKTLTAGTFTFTLTQTIGMAGVSIIIEDKLLHKTQNLAKTPIYSFASDVCNTTDRFVVHFNTSSALWNGTETWNKASNWLQANVPTSGTDVVIESGELTCNNNYKTADLTINAEAKLTINTNDTLSIQGNLVIKSNDWGTGTIVDNGTLIVSGTTTIEQYLTSNRNWYISSPISEATSNTVKSVNENKLWQYDEQSSNWDEITNSTTILEPLKGYIANVPMDDTIVFVGGKINTGLQSMVGLTRLGITNSSQGFNLIGNPYPSCVNWEMAKRINLESTLWYRTKNKSNAYVFDSYNADLHLGTNNNESANVTQFIPPMQAVWVRVKADENTASLSFDNTMRSHPQKGNQLKANIENEFIRLKVSNNQQSDETIIAFNSDAQNTFDTYDSEKMFTTNNNIPQIYTLADSEKLVINGFNESKLNQTIELGFKTGKAGVFTISANEVSGTLGRQVLLIDKELHKTCDLTDAGNYTFTSESVDNASRFAIRLKASSETTNIPELSDATIAIATQNHSIVVTTSQASGTITVYDLLGRIVDTKTIVEKKTVLESSAGVYFIKVQTTTNIATKKLIIE